MPLRDGRRIRHRIDLDDASRTVVRNAWRIQRFAEERGMPVDVEQLDAALCAYVDRGLLAEPRPGWFSLAAAP